MDFNAALRECNAQLIQRRFAMRGHPLANPISMSHKLRATRRVALLGGGERTG